ncbi:hypothetical protein D3C71_1604090 [compost metagenome]
MNTQLLLEPVDGVATGISDRRLHGAHRVRDAVDQAGDDHSSELGESAGHLDAHVVHHRREGLVDQPDWAEIGERLQDAADPAAEAQFDLSPGTDEVSLHLVPVCIDQIRSGSDGRNGQANWIGHEKAANPNEGLTDKGQYFRAKVEQQPDHRGQADPDQ